MAVDIQKLFNEEIPAKIAANADKAKEIGATYQFVITEEGGGEWFINAKDALQCIAGNPGGADCTLTLSAENFQKLLENPQANGMGLYTGGKLKVAGNPMLAMKLQKLFTL